MTLIVEASGLALAKRLEDTSLSLAGGELTCLVGPNGSGKTSLLHALAGIGLPSGKVTIDGIDPRQLAPAQRMKLLSYLPASREIHWPVTAGDLIRLGCSTPEDEASIPTLLTELELVEYTDRRIDRMSTGERSRVLIARALVSQAKLVLLDEPTANLDPLWQLRLLALLKTRLCGNGQSVLVAVHDLGLAQQFADRLIVMSRRRIAADGHSSEVFGSSAIRDIFGIEQREGRWVPAV